MKHSLKALLVATTFTLASAAYAGGGHGKHGDCHEGKRGKLQARFEQKLDLSAEQKTAIDEIYTAAKQQRKAEFEERAAQRQKMLEISPANSDYESRIAELARQKAERVEQQVIAQGAVQAQVYALLTPEQREKLTQLKQGVHDRHMQRRHRTSDPAE